MDIRGEFLSVNSQQLQSPAGTSQMINIVSDELKTMKNTMSYNHDPFAVHRNHLQSDHRVTFSNWRLFVVKFPD